MKLDDYKCLKQMKLDDHHFDPSWPSSTRVVSHDHIYKPDYLTISLKGVTRMRNDDETEFILLDKWEQEVFYFEKLIKVSETFWLLFFISSSHQVYRLRPKIYQARTGGGRPKNRAHHKYKNHIAMADCFQAGNSINGQSVILYSFCIQCMLGFFRPCSFGLVYLRP